MHIEFGVFCLAWSSLPSRCCRCVDCFCCVFFCLKLETEGQLNLEHGVYRITSQLPTHPTHLRDTRHTQDAPATHARHRHTQAHTTVCRDRRQARAHLLPPPLWSSGTPCVRGCKFRLGIVGGVVHGSIDPRVMQHGNCKGRVRMTRHGTTGHGCLCPNSAGVLRAGHGNVPSARRTMALEAQAALSPQPEQSVQGTSLASGAHSKRRRRAAAGCGTFGTATAELTDTSFLPARRH